MGTKVPVNERSLGTKVLHRDFSFLGTKGLGYEKSVIPITNTEIRLVLFSVRMDGNQAWNFAIFHP